MSELTVTVETYHQVWFNYAFGISAVVLVGYDWLLTLGDEIRYIWHKRNTAAYLYIATRYVGVMAYGPVAVSIFAKGFTESQCSILTDIHLYASIIIQALTAAVFILRIHALYRSRPILILLVLICIIALAVAIGLLAVPFHAEVVYATAMPGCNKLSTTAEGVRYAIVWTSVSVFDLAIAYLTLVKALRAHRHNLSDLWYVFMRDGFVYFTILFIFNTANILTFVLAPPIVRGVISHFTTALEVVLVCRMILNLRVSDAERRSAVEAAVASASEAAGAVELRVVVHTSTSRYGTRSNGGQDVVLDELSFSGMDSDRPKVSMSHIRGHGRAL
ncbi:unnamed protein product [Peniophora sp. CBMAI 1063]|nr:unnamed protein product [Peniophora sp. CBMAI 1063]